MKKGFPRLPKVKPFGKPPTPAKPPKSVKGRAAVEPRYTMADAGMARATAVNDRGTASDIYNQGVLAYNGDTARYAADLSTWNQVKAAMMAQSQADYDACYGFLTTAQTKGASEAGHLTDAYNRIGLGDADVTAGDASNDPDVKVPKYTAASGKYNTAKTDDCGVATTDHTTCAAALASAETILTNYG